jgi:fatty acid desaturase
MPGVEYLVRRGVGAFVPQSVPFLAYSAMRREKHDVVAFFDEALRVGTRVAVLLAWGPWALVSLLWWHFVFVLFIMYFNYLQHWRVPAGEAEVWNDPVFNAVYLNLGLHDEHHAHPARRFGNVSTAPRRPLAGFSVFNPALFAAFLVSRRWTHLLMARAFGNTAARVRDI